MIGVTKYCFHDACIACNLWYDCCKHQPTLHIVKCTMNSVIFLPRVGLVGGSSQCFANFWFCRSTPLEWNISVYLAVQWHKAFCIHNLSIYSSTQWVISFRRIENSDCILQSQDAKKTARLTLFSGSHRKNQTWREKTKTKNKKHTGMNRSASFTPVQGPSTVVCMIVA